VEHIVELRHLRYALAVAEERNFTRAAARLGIRQPPLSQQIRDLERELGVTLFHRLPYGAEPTDAGIAFVEEARRVLEQVDRTSRAAQRAGRGESGHLRLGFTNSSAFNRLIPGCISRFRSAYPGVALSLEEANTMHLLDRLLSDRLDAAFIRPVMPNPEGIDVAALSEEETRIVLPDTHPQAAASSLSLAALREDRFVLFPRSIGLSLFDAIVSACRDSGFEPVAGQEAPQISSVINLVAAGLGVSVVPASIAQIQVAGIRYLPIDGPAPVAHLALATRRHDPSPVVRNLLTLVRAFQHMPGRD